MKHVAIFWLVTTCKFPSDIFFISGIFYEDLPGSRPGFVESSTLRLEFTDIQDFDFTLLKQVGISGRGQQGKLGMPKDWKHGYLNISKQHIPVKSCKHVSDVGCLVNQFSTWGARPTSQRRLRLVSNDAKTRSRIDASDADEAVVENGRWRQWINLWQMQI